MKDEKYNTLILEHYGGIGHIIMNQPPSNMMTLEFFSELGQLVEEMKEMKELKAMPRIGGGLATAAMEVLNHKNEVLMKGTLSFLIALKP